MREYIAPTLFLLLVLPASAQTVPAGWKIIKDSKSTCQIAVPPEWAPFSDASGAAVLHDATNAIAVVTSQAGQAFKPMPANLLKVMQIPKEKFFENSVKRIFYQDRTSRNADETNAYSASVPGKDGGTCSCRVTFLPGIGDDVARKIALSLSPVTEQAPEH